MSARSRSTPCASRDEVDGVVQGAEHAQAEQVELDQPDRGAVVLVPLQHGAVLHAGPLDRAHLDHRPVAQHHAARVDAEVAGEVLDLPGQIEHRLGDLVIGLGLRAGHRGPAVDLLGPGVLLAGGVAEGPGHVAHRRAGPVGDDVGHLRRVLAPVAPVDVLDDLFAAVALDVDVDVGRTVALGGQEALEQQAEGHGVGLGDAEGEADRRVGRRPPALAEDVGPPAELDDVPHDEEVAGEAELLDDVELVVDLGPRARDLLGSRPAPAGCRTAGWRPARPARATSVISSWPGGHGYGGRSGATSARSKAHSRPSSRRPLDHARGSGRSGGPARPPSAGGRRPRPGASRPARRGCGGPAPRPARWPAAAGRGGVVDVVGGHDVDPGAHGQRGQRVVAGRVERVAVVPQLDGHVLAAEHLDQPSQLAARGGRPLGHQRRRHRPLAAPGEHLPVVATGRPASAASSSSEVRGAPFSPRSWAWLMARASRA